MLPGDRLCTPKQAGATKKMTSAGDLYFSCNVFAYAADGRRKKNSQHMLIILLELYHCYLVDKFYHMLHRFIL